MTFDDYLARMHARVSAAAERKAEQEAEAIAAYEKAIADGQRYIRELGVGVAERASDPGV